MYLIKYPDLWANDETEIWTISPQPMNTSVIETTFEDVTKQKRRNFVTIDENMKGAIKIAFWGTKQRH